MQQLQDCGTHTLGLMGARVGRAMPLSLSPWPSALFSAQEQFENGRGCVTSVREGAGSLKYLQTLKISLPVAALPALLWLSKYTQVNAQITNYYYSTPYLQIYLQFYSRVTHSTFTLLPPSAHFSLTRVVAIHVLSTMLFLHIQAPHWVPYFRSGLTRPYVPEEGNVERGDRSSSVGLHTQKNNKRIF